MAEQSKSGTIWDADELDSIVADYFAMLEADLAGQPYIKSRHSAALMVKIGRSHRSVEFKHQNISAVLDKLGMPWIPGYRPKFNFQTAIFDAIDRYLAGHPRILNPVRKPQTVPTAPVEIFVKPPSLGPPRENFPRGLRQLMVKFDPVERDHRNRSLGKAGEEFVFDLERKRLHDGERPDLAEKVRWTAVDDGDGAGYDVSSFSLRGDPQYLEVKTTNGSCRTPFFLTRNEYDVANQCPNEWRIYRVHLFATTPRVFTIAPPLDSSVRLSPESWRASF